MCDVTRIAVFCSESVEGFASMASKFVFKPFVTILVAPVSTSVTLHSMFHIRFISVHNPLYLSFSLLPFAWHLCLQLLPYLSVYMYNYYYYYYYYYYGENKTFTAMKIRGSAVSPFQ